MEGVLAVCGTCSRSQKDLPETLKKCGRCKKTSYCSVNCQTKDWPTHKKICPKLAAAPTSGTTAPMQRTPGFDLFNSFLGLDSNDHLQQLSRQDAMTQLIDCFRMRLEDECNFAGEFRGIYNEESSYPYFKKFLTLAEEREAILPSWWDKKARTECERLARGGDGWANIARAVEKSDIQEHYGDSMMPAKLRILGEKIYGKGFM